jgi:ATP synthase protein I
MRPSSQGPTGADMAGVGFYFAGAVLIPILGGVGLDAAFHTSPVFVLIGLFVGLAAGAAAVWLKIREFTR